jgi:hypothetical protein
MKQIPNLALGRTRKSETSDMIPSSTAAAKELASNTGISHYRVGFSRPVLWQSMSGPRPRPGQVEVEFHQIRFCLVGPSAELFP